MKLEVKDKNIKILFIISTIMLAIPSVVYLVMGKSISNLVSDFNYSLQIMPNNNMVNAMTFLGVFAFICIMYLLIIKRNDKLFVDNKAMFKFIIVVSFIFTIILPMTSTDVFYYISTGWADARYNINPYYTSVKELQDDLNLKNDEILNKMPKVWREQKIVYGPAWTLVCKGLSALSFGSLPIALLVYKLFNLLLHIANCFIIYKISKKKLITLIYGLNPLILFESLTNVHNDILLLFFMLFGLYFIFRRPRNFYNVIIGVVLFAMATAVKYVAILILPFIIIYYYRKDNVFKRILKAVGLAFVFLSVLLSIYLLYSRDLEVIQGIFTQQSKMTKSLTLMAYIYISPQVATKFSLITVRIFAIIYFGMLIRYLFKKNIIITRINRRIYLLLVIFLLTVITGFQTWYIMWLLPFIMWQRGKNTKSIIYLTIAAELSTIIFFAFGEWYMLGGYYYLSMIAIWSILNIVSKYKLRKRINLFFLIDGGFIVKI